MNAFHVMGGLLALWALVVSFLGITRENWPGDSRTERLVSAISILLVVGAISSAVITAIVEEHEEGEEEAALMLPR